MFAKNQNLLYLLNQSLYLREVCLMIALFHTKQILTG